MKEGVPIGIDFKENINPATKVILVDQDGVLANFEGEFLRRWRQQNPNLPYVPLQERRGFNIKDNYPKELSEKVAEIYNAPGFIANLPPISGAIEALKAMREARHIVQICTSPLLNNRDCMGEKHDWVVRHLGKEWIKNLIIAPDKTFIRGHFLIDDRSEVPGIMQPMWEHIVFDAVYNRDEGAKGKRRLQGWNDWAEIFENQISVVGQD